MRLGLGTAQFGLAYGATNTGGLLGADDVRNILERARNLGIQIIDTAATYGSSEKALGQHMPVGWMPDIVTKTPVFAASEPNAAGILAETAEQSLRRLRVDSVYGILLHHGHDLLGSHGAALIAALQTLKDSGRVQKIGVSVYSGEEIDAILARFNPDIVQLPASVADGRLADSGHIRKLADRGAEVHLRSVFLQGILLTAPSRLPAVFRPLNPFLAWLDRVATQAGVSRQAACLAWVRQLEGVSAAVVGVTSAAELEAIAEAWSSAGGVEIDWTDRPQIDHAILDPRRWPPREQLLEESRTWHATQ